LDLGFSLWFLLQYLLERGNLSTRPSRKIPYRGGSLFSSRSMNDSFIRLPRKVAKMSSRWIIILVHFGAFRSVFCCYYSVSW
jgi:hypothetical protein